ncbi:type II toxin-antitoxin system VapC family toxin [Nitrospirillum sp. BR 11828]|uniref:type II toxin-antitoxin system VapC family toxin n=1 Tax=Nitrospirillum sp. BR 11828 TaxID=3104325 RepID=UPI002ACAA612|nr:type II toxin-antitoxin system VapC family toxin [Nitrospirillum sp. BR 11828]MDZ5647469.1 type II toxin-antitoxin system VapC family toxin [Nitrospirillum sp. BR 11828]
MSEGPFVLDASAVLALIKAEPGADHVVAALSNSWITSVNFSEVVTKLHEEGWPVDDAADAVLSLGINLVDFSPQHAVLAAQLRPATRAAGLSLGDRACLALGQERQAKVLTADTAWLKVAAALQLEIIAIRQPHG